MGYKVGSCKSLKSLRKKSVASGFGKCNNWYHGNGAAKGAKPGGGPEGQARQAEMGGLNRTPCAF